MKRMWSKNELKNIADDRVQALVEGGALDNAKPIYCHPLDIRANNTLNTIVMTCLIFNNDPTPFTLSSFKEFLDNLYSQVGNVRIMASGGIHDKTANKTIINSFFYRATVSYGFLGINIADGSQYDYEKNLDAWNYMFADATITDGVNKIN